MIISMAYPGHYMRLVYIALVGLLIFDFALYPFAARAQSRRRDSRQTEEKPERREPTRPLQRLLLKKQREKLRHWLKSKVLAKRPMTRLFARVAILSGLAMFLPWL